MFSDPSKVHQLSNSNFKMVAGRVQVSLENNKPVVKGLMIAYAPWCPHCHSMENVWKKLSNKHRMYALDADSNSEARSQINLEGYPSFYVVNKSGNIKPVDLEDRSETGVEKVIKKFVKEAKKRSTNNKKTNNKRSNKKRSNKKRSNGKRNKKEINKKLKGGMKRRNLTIDTNVRGVEGGKMMEDISNKLLQDPSIKKRVEDLEKQGVRRHAAIAQADQERTLNK